MRCSPGGQPRQPALRAVRACPRGRSAARRARGPRGSGRSSHTPGSAARPRGRPSAGPRRGRRTPPGTEAPGCPAPQAARGGPAGTRRPVDVLGPRRDALIGEGADGVAEERLLLGQSVAGLHRLRHRRHRSSAPCLGGPGRCPIGARPGDPPGPRRLRWAGVGSCSRTMTRNPAGSYRGTGRARRRRGGGRRPRRLRSRTATSAANMAIRPMTPSQASSGGTSNAAQSAAHVARSDDRRRGVPHRRSMRSAVGSWQGLQAQPWRRPSVCPSGSRNQAPRAGPIARDVVGRDQRTLGVVEELDAVGLEIGTVRRCRSPRSGRPCARSRSPGGGRSTARWPRRSEGGSMLGSPRARSARASRRRTPSSVRDR